MLVVKLNKKWVKTSNPWCQSGNKITNIKNKKSKAPMVKSKAPMVQKTSFSQIFRFGDLNLTLQMGINSTNSGLETPLIQSY